METTYFLAILFLITALAFIVWALVSKRRTERKRDDPNAPKSTLAVDGPGPNPNTAPQQNDARTQIDSENTGEQRG
jgi:preprotein translocase subunit SecG